MRFLAFIILISSFSTSWAGEAPFIAKVVGVHDGDTITVYDGVRPQIKVRLAGIDAPELKQRYGQQAKAQLSKLIFAKDVKISPIGKERYGRTLADLECGKHWVNLQMVATGAAWRYDKYSQNPVLLAAQQQALKVGRGLWSVPAAITPWAWRAGER